MVFKIGGLEPETKIQQGQNPNLLNQITQNIGGGLSYLGEGVINTLGQIRRGAQSGALAQAGYPDYIKNLESEINQARGTNESGEPKGFIQETANKFGENIGRGGVSSPVLGAFSLTPAVGQAIGGQLGKEVGGKDSWSEFFGGLTGNLGADFIKKGGQGFIKSARTQGTKLYNQFYNQARPIAESTIIPTKIIGDSLNSVIKEAEEKLPRAALDEYLKDIKPLEKLIKPEEATLNNLWNEKTRWNLNKPSSSDKTTNYLYKKTGDVLRDTLNDYGNKIPEFGIPYQKAEDLYKGINHMSFLRELAEESTDLKKLFSKNGSILLKLLIGGGATGISTFGGPQAAALTTTGALGARSLLRGYDFFVNSAQGRKLLAESAAEAAFGDKTGFINTVKKMDKLFSHQQDEIEESKPKSGKFKVGGLS